MSPRLNPIENPSSPLLKLAYWLTKRKVGKVISPLKVIYSRLPVSFAMWMNRMFSLEQQLPLSEELRLLIRIYVAQLNTCNFCIDIARSQAFQKFGNNEKVFQLQEYENSSLFTDSERLALRFAKEITNKKVTDDTFREVQKKFSEEQAIGIAWMVTSEHVFNIMNSTFNIESDGFCDLKKRI